MGERLKRRTSTDIQAQVYRADGSEVGAILSVANSNREEFDPSVAMDNDGDFVVTWVHVSGTRISWPGKDGPESPRIMHNKFAITRYGDNLFSHNGVPGLSSASVCHTSDTPTRLKNLPRGRCSGERLIEFGTFLR